MADPLDLCEFLWLAWVLFWVAAAPFTLRAKKREGLARLQHSVPTAFGMVAVFHRGAVHGLDWGPLYHSAAAAWFGLLLTAAGQAFSVWARIHIGKYWSGTVALKKGHKIIDTGPYALVRHPIYTGLLAAALGSAMAAGTREAFAGVIVMIAAYAIKWRREEKLLLQEFGADYEAYRRRTRTIIPWLY